jgi:hypothetical protein
MPAAYARATLRGNPLVRCLWYDPGVFVGVAETRHVFCAPRSMLADIIGYIHVLIRIFLIATPFVGNEYLLSLHLILVPFIMLHWLTNQTVCALTELEKIVGEGALRDDTIFGQLLEPIYRNKSWVGQAISPFYEIQDDETEKRAVWLALTGLWFITLMRLAPTRFRQLAETLFKPLLFFEPLFHNLRLGVALAVAGVRFRSRPESLRGAQPLSWSLRRRAPPQSPPRVREGCRRDSRSSHGSVGCCVSSCVCTGWASFSRRLLGRLGLGLPPSRSPPVRRAGGACRTPRPSAH